MGQLIFYIFFLMCVALKWGKDITMFQWIAGVKIPALSYYLTNILLIKNKMCLTPVFKSKTRFFRSSVEEHRFGIIAANNFHSLLEQE